MTENKPIEKLLYTVEESAARLSVGITKTKELVRTGELRSVKIGRLRRITASSLREYVQVLELQELGKHA